MEKTSALSSKSSSPYRSVPLSLRLSFLPVEQFASCAGVDLPLLLRCRGGHGWPLSGLRFRALPCKVRCRPLRHDRALHDVALRDGAAELDRDSVRVIGINGMDEAMVDHLGDPDACRGDAILYLPQII